MILRSMLFAALLALPARADAAPASSPADSHVVGSGRFLIRAPGMTIGREAYVVSRGPGVGERTIVARAAASFRKGGTFRLSQHLVLDELGLVSGYDVTTDGPQGSTRASLVPREGGWTMTAGPAGGDSSRTASVEGPPDAVVLDPFFANHYQWLLDRIFASGLSAPVPDSLFVLTPQSLEARWAKIQEIQGEVGFEGDAAVTARILEVSIPGQTTLLWFDQNGTLLRARLEGQWMELVREGFRVAYADSTLPHRAIEPLPPIVLDSKASCVALSLTWPPSADAVALILPDGGPPGAPAESSSAAVSRVSDRLLECGVAVAAFDPSQSHCDGTTAITRGWIRPAQDALADLEAAGVPRGRIVLVGHGLGAVAACRIAASDSEGLGGVVLLAPPAVPARRWLAARAACAGGGVKSGDLGWTAADWADLDAFDPREAVASLRPPIFVLTGSDDCETGGARSLRAFANAIGRRDRPEDEVRLLPGLDHFFRPAGDSPGPPSLALAVDLALWIRTALPENR